MTASLPAADTASTEDLDDEATTSLLDLLTWIGDGKRTIAAAAAAAAVVALAVALVLPNVYTARASMLPPVSQQQGGSTAALAALGALGGLAGGIAAKTPDELYVALLKSDTVQRALAERFELAKRWDIKTYEQLRREFPKFVRISSEKKSGLITIEADDEDAAFAAALANAYAEEITRLLGRLAVTEAQVRRVFFEKRLKETKDNLVAAELGLRKVQQSSGVVLLDKQAEALFLGAAKVRAQIAESEVMLSVLRQSATAQNPEVQRLNAELAALRGELSRMEASPNGQGKASPLDMQVDKLSDGGLEYIRARRELKVQETLLESMIRQFELARLDEAKDGPMLQQVDIAAPPDRKSRPQRALIVLVSTLLAALAAMVWVTLRRYGAIADQADPESAQAWRRLGRAWRWRARA